MTAAVLLIHGQPGAASDWNAVVAALRGRVEAIAFDRPGWNGAGDPTGLEGNADAAIAALDERGIDRATIAGHSLGGAVAAWLAIRHPDRVAALVLAAPAANIASLDRLDRLLALPVAGELASATILSGVGLALATPGVRHRVAAGLRLDEDYLSSAARTLRRPPSWRSFVAEQRVLVRELPALERRLHEITAPTTIVSGDADRVVAAAATARLATQIRGAGLVTVARAGHLLPQRHAPELAEIVLAASGWTDAR